MQFNLSAQRVLPFLLTDNFVLNFLMKQTFCVSRWLKGQWDDHRSFAEERAQQLGTSMDELVGGEDKAHAAGEAARRQWREQRKAVAAQAKDANADGEAGEGDAEVSGSDTAVAALMRFEPKAAALVLEEEIREAVLSSVSSAIGEIIPQSLTAAHLRTTTGMRTWLHDEPCGCRCCLCASCTP